MTLTTRLYVLSSGGKNGGFPVYVLRRVSLKQEPQAGPYAVVLPYAIWLSAAVG